MHSPTCCRRCMAFWMCSSVTRSMLPPRPERDRDSLRSDTFFRAVSSCPAATSLNINQPTYRTDSPDKRQKHVPTPMALKSNSTTRISLSQKIADNVKVLYHARSIVDQGRDSATQKHGLLLRDAPATSRDTSGTKSEYVPYSSKNASKASQGRFKGDPVIHRLRA